jgi:hypothetical protein
MHICIEKVTNALSTANLQKTELKFLSNGAVAVETYNRECGEGLTECEE